MNTASGFLDVKKKEKYCNFVLITLARRRFIYDIPKCFDISTRSTEARF